MGLLLEYDPNPRQLEALEKWNDDVTEEIAFGGNKGGGKSNLGAACVFHDALVYPETRYFIARDALKDLRLYTVPSVHEMFQIWNIPFDKYCKFNGQDNNFTCTQSGSLVQLLECSYMPRDPMYERFGSMQWTRGWIEEGGEVSDLAYVNLKLGIGRWKNDTYNLKRKLLITCNPKKNWIKYNFVEPQKAGKLDKKKVFIASSVYDNKHRQRGYEKVLEELTGTSRQRLLLGNWDYDSDDDCLINSEKIFDLYNNVHVSDEGEWYITADVGRFGKDKTVIWVWKGFKVIRVVIMAKKNTVEVAEEIKRLQSIYQIPMSNVAVDDDGIGGGVVDNLTGCYGFVNNATPLPNIEEPKKKENFDNLKSQCYFALATKINEGGIWIDFDLSSEYVQEKTIKQLLNEDLEQVRQKEVDSDKKKGVLPKDKVKEILGRSPDYSDGMMMRMVFELSLTYSWTAM